MKSCNILRGPFWVREGFSWMGSQGKPWKLETRLDCVELAKEQDMREGVYILYRAVHGPVDIRKKLSHPIREIVTKERAVQ